MDWLAVAAGALVLIVLAAASAGLWLAWRTRRIAAMAERLVPPCGHFVEVDGARVHYVDCGEGPAIVLIHGLGGTLHHMRRPLMGAIGGGFRLIAMDRPGSGYSTRPPGEAGLARQALFVRRFIETLGLERPLLVGHSLGGAIAIQTALDHPGHVGGLALISPLTRRMAQLPPEFGPLGIASPWLRRLASRTMALPLAMRRAQKALAVVFGPNEPPEDYAVAGGAMAMMRPSHFVATSEDFVALDAEIGRIETRLDEIAVPVGIFFGDADRVLDHRAQAVSLVGRLAELEIEIAEGVGHMPQYSETARVAAFVRRIAARTFETRQAEKAGPL